MALRAVLPHVYLFNSPGTDQLSTHCPECQQVQLRRDFYGPMGARLMVAGNPQCSHGLEGTRSAGAARRKGHFREADFQGGYPFTRALEIVQAMLITLGVRESGRGGKRVWEIFARRSENAGTAPRHSATCLLPGYHAYVRRIDRAPGASLQDSSNMFRIV